MIGSHMCPLKGSKFYTEVVPTQKSSDEKYYDGNHER